jgi:hypothetical protein
MQKKAETAKINWDPVSFAEAEGMLPPLLQQWLPSQGTPAPSAIRAYLETNDWQVNRNEATGRVLNRFVNIAVVTKGGAHPDWCWARVGSLQQEEQGGRWSKPQLILPQQEGFIKAVTCSSAEALRPGVPM